jgi:hypothetical protein
LSALNQAQIREAVLARLTKFAETDEFAWYPAVGWVQKDGTPFGLAIELYGATRTNAQLDRLARVLFKMAIREPEIEVAAFKPPGRSGKLPTRPLREGSSAVYSIRGVGTRQLESTVMEYCVRLNTNRDRG